MFSFLFKLLSFSSSSSNLLWHHWLFSKPYNASPLSPLLIKVYFIVCICISIWYSSKDGVSLFQYGYHNEHNMVSNWYQSYSTVVSGDSISYEYGWWNIFFYLSWGIADFFRSLYFSFMLAPFSCCFGSKDIMGSGSLFQDNVSSKVIPSCDQGNTDSCHLSL